MTGRWGRGSGLRGRVRVTLNIRETERPEQERRVTKTVYGAGYRGGQWRRVTGNSLLAAAGVVSVVTAAAPTNHTPTLGGAQECQGGRGGGASEWRRRRW